MSFRARVVAVPPEPPLPPRSVRTASFRGLACRLWDDNDGSRDFRLSKQELPFLIDQLYLANQTLLGNHFPDFGRASGEMVCVICEQEFWRHPDLPATGWEGRPFLKVLCDGLVVKL